MSGDIQLRKRKGKGKKKDDTEDDVIDTKGKPMVNNSGKSQSNGDSSGIVAKIIFLMLLVSLSVVVALILVELRGKQAGLNDTVSVVLETDDETKEEEPAAPEIPTPNIHMDEEVIPEAPSPIPVLQHDIEEEYEPLEATPPLEEYLHVKEVIVEVPPQAEKPILRDVVPEVSNGYEKLEVDDDAHVVEVRESIPAEEAVKAAKIMEEVKVAASLEEALKVEIEEIAPIVEDVEIFSVKEPVKDEEIEGAFVEEVDEDVPIEVDAQVEKIENVTPIKEDLPMEKVEEVTSVEESPPVEKVEKKPIEEAEELAVSKDNEGEDIVSEEAEVEDIITEKEAEGEDIISEKEAEGEDFVTVDESKEFDMRVEVAETAAPAETLQDTESVEVEEELSIAKKVETLGAPAGLQESDEVPLEIKHEDDHKEEAQGHGKKGDDDDATDDTDYDDDDEDDDDEDEDDEDEDDVEKVKSKILGQEETEEDEEDWSQYGKDGGVRLLTDAYLRVESLAEDVLEKDPNNAMVAQLAPHLSGVLRAMEAGQTDGLLDTLKHIQVILEDIKSRIESGEDSSEPLKETIEDARQPVYEKADITSEIDHNLREELDAAEQFMHQGP